MPRFPLLEDFPLLIEDKDYSESKMQVIEFGDSYKVPPVEPGKAVAEEASAKKKGRTMAITTEDMQKRRNDVKARTTLLLALPDEHQDDLDTMILDDLYNHLKVYEPEVQKKVGSNSKNMAFISSSNTSSGKGKVPTASVPTASSQVSTVSTEIDEDDIEEMDIKWNLALLSMRADREPKSQDKGKRESYRKDPKVEEPTPKAWMDIDGIGWDWSYMANEDETMHLWQMMEFQ
ncbi:hypothetical protein Tco_0965164 [Tanacetum coccineum]